MTLPLKHGHGADFAIEGRAAVVVAHFGDSADGESGSALCFRDVVLIRTERNEVHGGRCGTLTRLPGVIYSLIRERHIQRLRLREHDGAVFGSPVMATSGYCTCRVVLVLRRANA